MKPLSVYFWSSFEWLLKTGFLLLLIYSIMYFSLFVGVLCLSLFCYVLLCAHSSFAIILKRKRKLIALILLSYRCIITINVLWLFLTVPWVGLQYVIVVFPDHTNFFTVSWFTTFSAIHQITFLSSSEIVKSPWNSSKHLWRYPESRTTWPYRRSKKAIDRTLQGTASTVTCEAGIPRK